MAKEFKFVARIDTTKLVQDTNQIRNSIETAFAPVQFRLPEFNTTEIERIRSAFGEIGEVNIAKPIDRLQKELIETEKEVKSLTSELNKLSSAGSSSKAKKPTASNSQVSSADDRLEREKALLEIANQRLALETQRQNAALSALNQQIALSNTLAEVRLEGERAAARVAEESRQRQLESARLAGGDTTNLELQNARKRQEEEKKIIALVNQVGQTRLQNELKFERASASSTAKRLQAEIKVATAVERTAQAQVKAAQVAASTTTDSQQKVAAEERVTASIQAATAAQQRRIDVEQRLAGESIESEKRIAAASERAADQRIADERRVQQAKEKTAAINSNIEKKASGSGGGNALRNVDNLANLLTGGIQAFATVQLVRQINNVVGELDRLRVEADRSKVSLDILSGSSSTAAARIAAIQKAGGGTINTLTAIQIGVQATALGIANTTEEFEKLTTAARAVTLVSPIIKDINGALAEISLAGANESFRRLDQLGLGVQEVKDKIDELQAADKNLSDQQAFSAAVIDTLNSKYGELLKTTEAQASGQEQLSAAFSDFQLVLADTKVVDFYNEALSKLADNMRRVTASFSGDFSFFGNADEVQGKILELNEALEKTRLGITNVNGVPIQAIAVESQKNQLEELLPLFERVEELQRQGAIGADEYAISLSRLAGEVSQNVSGSNEYADEISALSERISAANSLLVGNSQAAELFRQVQEDLGKEFIQSDEDAKRYVGALVDLQAQFESGGNTQEYQNGIRGVAESFDSLTEASRKYREEADAKKRVELIGEAEQDFIQQAKDYAQGLVEAGLSQEEAVKEFERQKAIIIDYFEKLPLDINPDVIPISLATLQFNIDTDQVTQAQTALEDQRKSLIDAVKGQAEGLIESGKSADVAIAFQKEQIEKVNAFVDGLAGENLTPEEIVLRTVEYRVETFGEAAANPVAEAQKELIDGIRSQLTGLVAEGLSKEDALALIGEYARAIGERFAAIPKEISSDELGIVLTEYQATLDEKLATLKESLSFSDISPDLAADDILTALGELNAAAADSVPGLEAVRESLIALYGDIESQGHVTREQADELERLTGIAYAVGDATGTYASAVADLGGEFFEAHSEAGSLFDAIAQLEGRYVNGQVPLDEYKGAMLSLIERLVEVAIQAGVTGDALAELLGIKTSLETSGLSLGTGFAAGKGAGDKQAEKIELENAARTRKEEKKLADQATRAWEKAASEAERAAQRAAQAFESSLQNVEGLFGTSDVTQEQLDLAEAGIPQNFADDFVRRLEDVVVNGVQRSDVSVDQARQALQNININTEGLNEQQILQIIKQTWEDSSLFASDANLELLNVDAVKASLDLQQKAEEGRQNIVDYLAETFDVNVAALTGGGGAGAGSPAQIAAQQQALQAQSTLSLDVDTTAIDALATQSAALFAQVFSEYDFSAMAVAPANAMLVSLADGQAHQMFINAGVSAANLVHDAFTGRVDDLDWLTSMRDAFYNDLLADTTSAVLSSLAS